MAKTKIKVTQQGGGGNLMAFTTLERIILQGVMPQAGDYTTLGLVRQLQNALSFNEAEHKALQISAACSECGGTKSQHAELDHPYMAQQGRLAWRSEGDKPKAIEIGPKVKELIAEQLKALEKEKRLTLGQLGLYERFCLNGKVE